MVLGIEADLSFVAEPIPSGPAYEDAPQAAGTSRGRLGYAIRRWLVYATGGAAWTRDQINWTGTAADPSSAQPPAAAESTALWRQGWTLGGGVETALGSGWAVKAEYLYAQFGTAGLVFLSGARVASELSTSELRVGLNFKPRIDESGGARLGFVPLDLDAWSVHGQTTYVSQYALPFHTPYTGPNSLTPDIARETWDATLYVGRRLWEGGELWIDPEIDQGFGLSNTLGIAGFTSGEAYKIRYSVPYFRVPRVFIRQTFNLGGTPGHATADINQFAEPQTANRLVVTAGRFSVSDPFDTISYAHDPRNDFLNWTLIDAGTFDYAADPWGFTYGTVLEWYEGHWTSRAGLFDLSIVPNNIQLDPGFAQYQVDYEVEHRHTWQGRPGKVALVGYVSRGRMGSYQEALARAETTGTVPNTADVRRYATRPGVNLNAEQQVAPDISVFGRLGRADGALEPFEFTDVDRTASAGVSLGGSRWGWPNDTVGVAGVINRISNEHEAYLAAGGFGILVGDGQLPHPGPEQILETYYRLPLGSWQVTLDYQFIVNPAYNRDRGPVSVITVRLHSQF